MQTIRSVLAVVIGAAVALLLMAALTTGATQLVSHSSVASGPMYVAASLVAMALAGVAGGYVSAVLAPDQHEWHAATIAALLLGLGVAAALHGSDGLSTGVAWLVAIVAPAAVIVGARLHVRARSGSALGA